MDDFFSGDKLQGLMQKAKELQDQLESAKERATTKEVTGESGGGLVKVTINGALKVKAVKLDPITVTDIEMLEDLITAATNDALNKAQALVGEELGPLGSMLKGSGFGPF